MKGGRQKGACAGKNLSLMVNRRAVQVKVCSERESKRDEIEDGSKRD